MPGEELIIDIEDNAETLPDLADAKKAVGTEPAKPIKVDEPVEDLRKQLQTLKEADAAKDAALATAQAEARQRAQEVENARRERDAALTGKVTSDASAIESAITAEKQAMASAKAAKIAAYQAGDFDKAADADELMATAAARLSRFEEAHEEIKSRIEKPVTQERKPAQADAFEQSISNVTPRAQAWLRAHPEFVTDTKLNNKAAAAHNMAKSEGHVVDSDAYYDFCERFLGLKKDESEPEPKPKPTRTKPMPSALKSAVEIPDALLRRS